MNVKSAQAVSAMFPTHNVSGASANADSTPTGTLYVNGTANGATVTVTNVATGLYRATFTTPTGLIDYDHLELLVSATIGGTAARGKVWSATKLTIQAPAVLGRYDDPGANYPNITCIVGETGVPKSVTVTDTAGDPVDLTDWGDKVIVIERPNKQTDIQVIPNASITISGDDNEIFSFQPDATVLADKADFRWSLREVSTGNVIVQGRLAVTYAPLDDTP